MSLIIMGKNRSRSNKYLIFSAGPLGQGGLEPPSHSPSCALAPLSYFINLEMHTSKIKTLKTTNADFISTNSYIRTYNAVITCQMSIAAKSYGVKSRCYGK